MEKPERKVLRSWCWISAANGGSHPWFLMSDQLKALNLVLATAR